MLSRIYILVGTYKNGGPQQAKIILSFFDETRELT